MIGEDYRVSATYTFRVPVRDAAGTLQTGKSPTVAIYKPDGSTESSPPSLSELGSAGVYGFAYTFPATAGAYTFLISAANALTIVFTVQVRSVSRGDLALESGGNVAAVKAKTDNLPASPAATGDIPTAGQTADAVWDEALSGHAAAGSAGQAQGRLDATVSSRSSHDAADVWSVGTRTLTSFGTLVADVASAVWAATARTLTSFSALATDVWTYATRDLTDKAGFSLAPDQSAVTIGTTRALSPTERLALADALLSRKPSDVEATAGKASVAWILALLSQCHRVTVTDDGDGTATLKLYHADGATQWGTDAGVTTAVAADSFTGVEDTV